MNRRVAAPKLAAIRNDADTAVRDSALERWGDRPALVFGKWNVERPPATRHRLIWSKAPDPGTGDLSLPWGNSDEEIYVLGTGFVGSRTANVLTFSTVANGAVERSHPTPKPVALMRELVARCSQGTVVDPFAGSGSTLRAAKDLGRRCVGVELDERFCELAAKRCGQEVLL